MVFALIAEKDRSVLVRSSFKKEASVSSTSAEVSLFLGIHLKNDRSSKPKQLDESEVATLLLRTAPSHLQMLERPRKQVMD